MITTDREMWLLLHHTATHLLNMKHSFGSHSQFHVMMLTQDILHKCLVYMLPLYVSTTVGQPWVSSYLQ